MRICMYTDTALPKAGEQEIAVDALARQFVALGHQVAVLAPQPRGVFAQSESAPYGIARHPRFLSTRVLVGWYRRFLLQQYHRQRFDLLHCHGIYPASYLAALLGEHLPVPVIVTAHANDVCLNSVRLQKPAIVERSLAGLRRADAVIAVNQVARDGVLRLCPEKAPRIVEIPHGVDLQAPSERAGSAPVDDGKLTPGKYALFALPLRYSNGADVLLQGLARAAQVTSVQLALVGEGEERAILALFCDQLGLNEVVHFVAAPSRPAKHWLLQNARFGVIPARAWHSCGQVVLEGQAAGLPMIVTDLPGLTDLVQHDKTGFVVPTESPDVLAAALVRLFNDDALRWRMSAAARQLVLHYDWRTIAERHVALYEDLLQSSLRLAA